MKTDSAEHHVQNLRFRDHRSVFNASATWLDAHRDEALPVLQHAIEAGGPEALGAARVLGVFGDARAVPALREALGSTSDELAFEAARALARTTDPAASDALIDALNSGESGVIKNALRGAELRKDAALCPAIRAHAEGAAPLAEYAQRALIACGC